MKKAKAITSFSVFTASGEITFNSGDELEGACASVAVTQGKAEWFKPKAPAKKAVSE